MWALGSSNGAGMGKIKFYAAKPYILYQYCEPYGRLFYVISMDMPHICTPLAVDGVLHMMVTCRRVPSWTKFEHFHTALIVLCFLPTLILMSLYHLCGLMSLATPNTSPRFQIPCSTRISPGLPKDMRNHVPWTRLLPRARNTHQQP